MSDRPDINKEEMEKILQYLQNESLLLEDTNSDDITENYGEEYLTQLQEACLSFLKKDFFKVGQIVKWKQNMKNRRLPYQGQPAIVVAVLDEPIVNDREDSGSPYFLENLDIILGILVKNNTFLTFYYDSRRFELY